jgi:Ohr subfamily peroxiredoxin
MKGSGRTSDGNLEVEIRPPKDLGGDGTGVNPEQLFALGYAACFENAMSLVARRMKEDVEEARVDSVVGLHPTEERGFALSVELHVTLPSVDDEKAVEITRVAHKVCPYSNATKGNIEVKLTANGQPAD